MLLRNAEFLRRSQPIEGERNGEKIVTSPPFLSYIEGAIWKTQGEEGLQQVLQQSHLYDRNFFAWETNRKCTTPIGCFGTGYEGFMLPVDQRVGVSEDEVFNQILDTGHSLWTGIRRIHKHSSSHRSQLEKVIRGEVCSSSAIEEWSAIFGASLARKRAEILTNRPAQEYRAKMKERAQTLPHIRYVVGPDGQIQQEYFIIDQKHPGEPTTFGYLSDEQELALVTMRNIGKFGHPLVRAAMSYSRK